MKQLLLICIIFSVVTFGQHSIKIGGGAGFLTKLTKTVYGLQTDQSPYFSGTTEIETYLNTGVGIAVDAELTSVNTTSIGGSLKIANAKWEGARKYAYVFYAGALNKGGNSIVVLGLGLDSKLSWIIPRTIDVFKDIDLQFRVYLPAKMFSAAKISNDVCAKICINYRLIKL